MALSDPKRYVSPKTPNSLNASRPSGDSHNANNARSRYHTRFVGYQQPLYFYSRT